MRAALLASLAGAVLTAQDAGLDAMLKDRLLALPNAGIIVIAIGGPEDAGTVTALGKGPGGGVLARDSTFDAGGMGEVFLGVALADMVAKGDVVLTDPVARHLPGVVVPTRDGKSITLEDLAVHRSGLPRRPPNAARPPAGRFPAYTLDQLREFLSGYELTRGIGERFERSLVGTSLLAAAMASRAGSSLDALIAERVIGPLGLAATSMKDGVLRSTPADLARFAAAHLRDGPHAAVLADARSSRSPTGAPGESLGLGWRIRQSGPRQIVWTGGSSGRHEVFVGLEPATGRAAVALNTEPLTVDDVGFRAIELMRESGTPVDLSALERLTGEYEFKPGLRAVVELSGRTLTVKVGDAPVSTLTQDSELRFVFDAEEARLTFVRDEAGRTIGLILHRGMQYWSARKVK